MTRYIDADKLLLCLSYQKELFKIVHGGRSGFFAKGVACGLDGAIQSVKNAEAEDVSPVKHGKWIHAKEKYLLDENDEGAVYKYEDTWTCSECGYKIRMISKPDDKFCKECGADMRMDG